MTELAKKLPGLVAMVCLTILGVMLMEQGLDSFMIGLVLVAIAGLGGFELKEFLRRRLGP